MRDNLDSIIDLTLNALESFDLGAMPSITVVCGAGLGVEFGIPAFHGKNGILQSRQAAMDVIDKSSDNAYVRYRDRDNELICGVVNSDGSRTEIPFRHILSNDCLERLPVFFYSFLGCFFSEEKLRAAQASARNMTTQTYIDYIEFLQGYCDVKNKRCNIFTLNIDGTLEAMGIHAVEVHGRMGTNRCSSCGSHVTNAYPYIPRSAFSGRTDEYLARYRCPKCGGYIRPDIVLMDENESPSVLADLARSLRFSACIVSIGVNEGNHIGQLLSSEAQAGGKCLIAATEDGVVIKEKGKLL